MPAQRATALERQLPAFTSIEVIRRYPRAPSAIGSKLVILANDDRVHHQLSASGLVQELGTENVDEGTEWLGEATGRAWSDAETWIRSRIS